MRQSVCAINSNGVMLNALFDDVASAERWAEKHAPSGSWSVVATYAPPGMTREQWRAVLQTQLNAHDLGLS